MLDQLAGLYVASDAPAAGARGEVRPGPTPATAFDEKQMREDMLEFIKLSGNERGVVDKIIAKHAGRAMPLKEVPPDKFPAIHADVLTGLQLLKSAPAAPMGADDL